LGKVLHISNNKNLILRTKIIPKVGSLIIDSELEKVGIVLDIFGPTVNPYVMIKPQTENPVQYVGQLLYGMND
jgi:rRNA processing protein Gar1